MKFRLPRRWNRIGLSDWPHRVRFKRTLVLLLALAFCHGLWPYATLWQLSRAALHDEDGALSSLVDLAAVRRELARRLDKDQSSIIGPLSDAFIDWLEAGIRRYGVRGVDERVTLDWVRGQLLLRAPPGQGFLPALTYAWFVHPGDFRARIGAPEAEPVQLRLELEPLGWRITAIYR